MVYLAFFVPYLKRLCLRPSTPAQSSLPRMMSYRTAGRSRTRPPGTGTIERSCRLWPSQEMYAVVSRPYEIRTRAILRSEKIGFFGVIVFTMRQTPRFSGLFSRTWDLDYYFIRFRP